MTRSAAREIAVQMLYALSFEAQTAEEILEEWLASAFYERLAGEDELYGNPPGPEEAQYIRALVLGVVDHAPEIDSYIEKYSIGWEFGRIPRTASMAMRVAMYEVLYRPDVPNAAAINEAVEIEKHYDTREVVSFVNGILGTFSRAEIVP
ncbi:MAG: transcription antitermination factor NusB [Oscillospiraceae bacterium]|jgi:N utilization substance protein B|nr:transcription antitermination factor NusB [Oscillospiraceae bacterium]